MDTSAHDLNGLFKQLGLPAEASAIKDFVDQHSLAKDQRLAEASFWSPNQAAFLEEAIADDSDWAEVVDQLDAMLRH